MANLQAFIALGWSPELARATTVGITGFQVVGWIGGNGTAPVTGQYVGTASLVTNITDMANFGGGGGIGSINVSAGTTSNLLTNLIFSNSNGVTFGLNASTVTASIPNIPSTAGLISAINVSAGTTSSNISAITFSNKNGISFGFDGTNLTGTVATNYQSPGAYLTTAMQSNAATISNINISGGTTSSNVSAVTFNNSNGVSFGYD